MARINGLPDLCRFVRRTEKVKMYNTVQLVIGKEMIEVSGCVMSQRSKILEDLMGKQYEIYLDQFVGEKEGIQDCVEMLYGGTVVINTVNIKTILKFSVMYQILDMYKLCMDWIERHISSVNLFSMIELGVLIDVIGQDRRDLLDLCKNFIMGNVKDDLFKLSQSWSFSNNINFIKFLIQEDILYFTLPILTSWVSNDSHIRLILEEIAQRDLTHELFKHESRTNDLIIKMTDKMEVMETSKRLHKLQINISMSVGSPSASKALASSNKDLATLQKPELPPPQPNVIQKVIQGHWSWDQDYCSQTLAQVNITGQVSTNKDITTLLSEDYPDYKTFSVDIILELEEEYKIEHFEYVDIALDWIMSNTPSQEDVNRLWSNVRECELSDCYSFFVRNTIVSLNKVYTVPEVVGVGEYQYLHARWMINELYESGQVHSLLNNNNVVLQQFCSKCHSIFTAKIRLEDDELKRPCYILDNDPDCLHQVRHWYISRSQGGDQPDRYFFSLITNYCDNVTDMIKEHSGTCTLCCLYKCRSEMLIHNTNLTKTQGKGRRRYRNRNRNRM